MEALVVYYGKKSTTRRFAEAIANLVRPKFKSVNVKSIDEATVDDIKNCDVLYLGCWTSGMIFGQKPEQPWVNFVSNAPVLEGKRTVLFTTYRLSNGKMFQRMKQHLQPKGYKVIGSIKSQDGAINDTSFAVLRYSVA